nr:hypothetical protein [Tanacetum cinerariifolium]
MNVQADEKALLTYAKANVFAHLMKLVRGSKCQEVCVVMYDAMGKKWKSRSKGSFALSCMGLWTKNTAKEAGQ